MEPFRHTLTGAIPLARSLGEYAAVLAAQAPDAALDAMRLYVLDTLAVMIAGSTSASSRVVLRSLARADARGEATVAAAGRIASRTDAALINGAYSHALELDDDHRVAVLHPGAVVVPAALAACEAQGTDGRTFLAAVLGGYEIMCRLGLVFRGSPFQHGLHPTAIFGVFGAAAAAGIAMSLDGAQMTHCLGIAGTQASGLTEWRADGSWIKRLHPGRAAHSGVLSAALAAEGFTGPATILEGPGGFFTAFGHGEPMDTGVLVRDLGTYHHALDTAIKPYPCCRFMHGALDLALDARAAGLDAAEIALVDIEIYETGVLTLHKIPMNAVDAQFNVPYGVACALKRGAVTLDDFTEQAVRDSDTLALCQRVNVRINNTYSAAYPDVYNVAMIVTLASGERRRYHSTCPSGDPQAPAYAGQHARLAQETDRKAAALLAQCGFPGLAEQLHAAIRDLPQARNLDALISAVATPARRL